MITRETLRMAGNRVLGVTFRTSGGWPAKIISASAAILAFVFFGSY